ncbi:GIY-YIG nuclease family protein [Aeromonas piscicola]|uniref:GIY-YIG nuclease family protein n=1 Tax=Aeromonas piscicola TaxID=600645 RepID=UPI0021F91BA9|nr:GIY-YIG nuclease family protein [Aeromonas piscicola]MCW0504317.1 GIY-YIG nuclease family protein [Aeromonas piscicola]
MHYVYVLSNPSFKDNILKIGFTSDSPKQRADCLSRHTGIPLNFEVEYYTAVQDKFDVEIRTHLLLDRYRINQSKEFFKIPLKDAIKSVELAADYTENHDVEPCDSINLDNRLHTRNENPKLNSSGSIIWYLMMANTPSNTRLDILLSQHDVNTCFMSAKQYSEYRRINIVTARRQLKCFCLKYKNLYIRIDGEKDIVPVFDELGYLKGHCMWSFARDFRKLFFNHKITHLYG